MFPVNLRPLEGKRAAGTTQSIGIKAEAASGAPHDWEEVSTNKSDSDCTIVGGSTTGYMALQGAFNPYHRPF